MKSKIDCSTYPARQMVMFRTKVGNSKYGQKYQAVQGLLESESKTHITVLNLFRMVDTGEEKKSIRTFRKELIFKGQHGISRMNF